MTVLAIIPARGGSKRLPGKNLRTLAGKPLIAYTIDAATNAECISTTMVTSDDPAILETARRWGADTLHRRPDSLATDDATTQAVIIDAMANADWHDYVCVLQPTSPLRTADDIDATFDALVRHGADIAVTCDSHLSLTGAVYVAEWDWFIDHPESWYDSAHTVAVGMPDERCVDIDTAQDLAEAERRLAR